jgi:hypothetical protein
MQTTDRHHPPAVRPPDTTWPWLVAWAVIGLAVCLGIAGALTIGIFVLPVALLAAALLGVAQHTRGREHREATITEWQRDVHASPATNRLAKLSLVLGIASMVASPPTAIAGVVTGVIARREIRRSGGAETGSRLALAGIITSLLGLTIVSVLLLALQRTP